MKPQEMELGLVTSVTADSTHVTFIFSGPKEQVKKLVRDAIYGGVIDSCLFKKSRYFEEKYPHGAQFEISISNGHFPNLTNMFWYIAKTTGRMEDENHMRDAFDNIDAYFSFMMGKKTVYAKLSWVLHEAILAAKGKMDQPLEIRKHPKPIDRILWTAAELQAHENAIQQAEKSKQIKKFGLFAVAITGVVALAASAVYGRSATP